MSNKKNLLQVLVYFIVLYSLLFFQFILRIIIPKRSAEKNSVLYLENFPPNNSGFQYRAQKWVEILRKDGIKADVKTLIESAAQLNFVKSGHNLSWFFSKALLNRFSQILSSRDFKVVVLRRELVLYHDYGMLFFEKFLLSIHPNVILDFDDDIAASKGQPKKVKGVLRNMLLEDGNKFNNSLLLHKKFIVASDYLLQYIKDRNESVSNNDILVLPTCVDYQNYPAKRYNQNKNSLAFGWIGGTHNYHELDKLIPVLNSLSSEYEFRLIVIGGEKYSSNANFKVEFKSWSIDKEIEYLYDIDIGLMPLTDNAISRGKGGFKLIQYMGLGIVSVASPVTINEEIVDHEVNSFLASTAQEWKLIFERILEGDVDLSMVGRNARKKITDKYSFESRYEDLKSFLFNAS